MPAAYAAKSGLKVARDTAEGLSMDPISGSQLSNLAAASGTSGTALLMLGKALDTNSSSVMQLLQTMPQPPQKAGAGSLIDTFA